MACIEFTVNGDKCMVDKTLPRDTSLNAYLRYELQLPGTKAMCHEGGCGACIVSVRAPHLLTGDMQTFSVNSCLVLVFSCQGWEITTVEGVGNRNVGYHPIQKRMRSFNGTQCGYCSPGWVMQMYSLKDKNLSMAELERSFGSNTCRCTGYRPILDTMKSFATDADPKLFLNIDDIEDLSQLHICKNGNGRCERKCSIKSDDSDWTIISDEPPVCKTQAKAIEVKFDEINYFYKVFKIEEIFDIFANHGVDSYMLIAGNTGKGIVETFEYPKVLIDINNVKLLKQHIFDQNLVLGANISLEDTKQLFEEISTTNTEFSYLKEFAKHFDLIAHIPVRKIGTLAGNLMLKHSMPAYPSDIFLLFESVGAMVTLQFANNVKKTLSLTNFLSTDVKGCVMINIELPPLNNSYILRTYKIMPRNQNSLAIVNAAFLIKSNKTTSVVDEATIVYGNISPTFVHATKAEQYLIGKKIFDNTVLQGALKILSEEIIPIDNPPEDSPECRKKLALGIFYKFVLNISPPGTPSPRLRSGGQLITRPVSHGTQNFQSDQGLYPLNQAAPKLEALIQAGGEAEFINDIPNYQRQVFAAFVLSTIHSGDLGHVDATEVLAIPGVLAVYTAKDISGINTFVRPGLKLIDENEEILAGSKIKFYGQPVAIVVAKTERLAADVAKKVKVKYTNVSTAAPVLTIDDAKKASKRVAPSAKSIEPKGKGTNVKKIIKGVYEIEAQYHYYMEPMTCLVVPVDNGLEVYSATQWMDLAQIAIADCLNMKESDVFLKVRRIGGGFGGKLSRCSQVSTACALVAKKMNLPCRFILPLQTNLAFSGKRLPCQTEYEVGVDDLGKIQYLNSSITEDDGCSHNENVFDYTVGGFKNCYNFDYWSLKGVGVLTDLPSNTFVRAPGTLEGMASIEHIMEHIAFAVKKDPTDVRLANMRQEDNDIPELITQFKKEVEFDKRAAEIKQFNEMNRWMKKAITVNPMLFPLEYFGNYSALVSIYKADGSVTVTTGGIEMGQGINTKAAQVCAYTLGIPLEYVSVLPNFSFSAANNNYSAASITSECVCFAIVKACKILQDRLQPIKDGMTNPTWKELITKAGDEQVDMVASYMMTDKEPELSSYSVYSVAILEVQLDVLLGRYEILRVDILEDVGLSANPLVDVGQVEGAFVQGLGYFTTEKLKYDKKTGKLLTNRSLNYHVPLALDIPVDFRVKLRYNSKNPKGVLSSKAVGEMGVCTSHSITHALRQCILESRKETGWDESEWLNIDIPYTTESILKALDVKLSEFVLS